jgi:carboxypeptidase T
VPIAGRADVAQLERLGFDVDHEEDLTATSARVVVDSDAERARLAQAFAVREVVPDYDAYLRRALSDDRVLDRLGRSAVPSGRDSYRVPADYPAALDELAQSHPGVVRRVELPRKSVEGRALPGVEIAGDVNRSDDGRPVYVVMGLHHAREWPSAEVSMEFALDLARGYGSDARITALLARVRVFVFPVINPDGYVVSRGEVPLAPGGVKPLQRKNCAGDQSQPCESRLSTDLNRNYGAYWRGNGASTNPSSDTYRGPAPWSEPESRAVWEFSQQLHITNFQSIHNVAALILRPPGFKALGLAPDEARLKELGDAMGDATGYSSEYGYQLYEVTGATEDWNYVAQNAFGYTIELGGEPGSPVFHGPHQSYVVDQYLGTPGTPTEGRGVREALLLAGEQAGDVRDHAIVAGSAPAGHTLRLRKTFRTTTSPICQTDTTDSEGNCTLTAPAFELDDFLDTQLAVPESGRFAWHVAPSTRPFERKEGRTESWELSCEAPNGTVVARRDLAVGIG